MSDNIVKHAFYHSLALGMIGLMHNGSRVHEEYSAFFDTWMDKCDERRRFYHNYMTRMTELCEGSSIILQDIQDQLLYFQQIESFDQNDLKEIKKSLEIINTEFEAALEIAKYIRQEGSDAVQRILKDKKKKLSKMKLYGWADLAISGLCGKMLTFMTTKDCGPDASSALCHIFGVSLAVSGCVKLAIAYRSSYDDKGVKSIILKKVRTDMHRLAVSADLTADHLERTLKTIKSCLSSVELMNLDRIFHRKGATIVKTDILMRCVGKLALEIKNIAVKTEEDTAKLHLMSYLRSAGDFKHIS